MNPKWIVTLLSLFTIFGGHWINRRWDRVLLFIFLLYIAPFLFFSLFSSFNGVFPDTLIHTFPIFIAALCLLSAIITYHDTSNPNEGIISKGLKHLMGISMTLTGILVIYASATISTLVSNTPSDSTTTSKIISHAPNLDDSKNFLDTTSISYGKFAYSSNKLLGIDNAILIGKVTANSKPLEGFKLRLKFFPDIKTAWVTTNKKGEYQLNVPAGDYRYAGYDFDGHVANKLLSGMINLNGYMGKKYIYATLNQKSDAIDFDFSTALTIISPKSDEVVEKENLIFSWEKYPDADYYSLMFQPRGKNGTTYGEPIRFGRNISVKAYTTSMSADELGLDLKVNEFYAWQLRAYSSDNDLLSTNPQNEEMIFKVR